MEINFIDVCLLIPYNNCTKKKELIKKFNIDIKKLKLFTKTRSCYKCGIKGNYFTVDTKTKLYTYEDNELKIIHNKVFCSNCLKKIINEV